MIEEKIEEGRIKIPGHKKLLPAKVYLNRDFLIEISKNPNGNFNLATIPVLYFRVGRKTLYTAIHCIWVSEGAKCYYTPNEFYRGDIVKKYPHKIFKSVTASVTYLTEWLNFKHFDISTKEKEFYSAKINYGDKRVLVIKSGVDLIITPSINSQFESRQLLIKTKSELKILFRKNTTRQELFSMYTSFLNLFTLFLPKLPKTFKLSFGTSTDSLQMLSLPDEPISKTESVILRLDEIENFPDILQNYFKTPEEYDKIIELWEVSLGSMDPEIKFLHLTQALETFHRSFLESKIAKREISKKVRESFGTNEPTRDWTQLMRYYHLFELVEKEEVPIRFYKDKVAFLKHLRNSRNYYTHRQLKPYVWTPFELYRTNRILRIWVRYLLLRLLGLQEKNVKPVIRRETFLEEDIDLLDNEYSMRYRPK